MLHGFDNGLPPLFVRLFRDLLGEVQIVPADDDVSDQPIAAVSHFLLGLFGVEEFLIAAEIGRVGELVRVFPFVELLFDRLPQFHVVDPREHEEGLLDLSELFQRPVQGMLLGIGIEPFKELRRGRHFQFDGGDEAQDVVPVLFDEPLVDVAVREDPVFLFLVFFPPPEAIEFLSAETLDARCEGDAKERYHPEQDLGITAGIRRMDIAFDDLVVHEEIDDVVRLAVGDTDDEGMRKKMPFVDHRAGTDSFLLAEVFERMAGVKAIDVHAPLLAVAGRMESVPFPPAGLWEPQPIHELQDQVVSLRDVAGREVPVDGLLQIRTADLPRDPGDLPDAHLAAVTDDPRKQHLVRRALFNVLCLPVPESAQKPAVPVDRPERFEERNVPVLRKKATEGLRLGFLLFRRPQMVTAALVKDDVSVSALYNIPVCLRVPPVEILFHFGKQSAAIGELRQPGFFQQYVLPLPPFRRRNEIVVQRKVAVRIFHVQRSGLDRVSRLIVEESLVEGDPEFPVLAGEET